MRPAARQLQSRMLARTRRTRPWPAPRLPLGKVFDLGRWCGGAGGHAAVGRSGGALAWPNRMRWAFGPAAACCFPTKSGRARRTWRPAVSTPLAGPRIARGADLDLSSQADAAPEREVPETVEIRYVQGSSRGRETMGRSGNARAEPGSLQNYTHTFKDVLTPLEFYVRGGDDRLGPLHLDVVDSPTVGQMMLHCEYPAYMNREPRDLPVAGAVSLPRGTRVTVMAETNKDIVQAQIDDLSDEQTP